MGVQHELTDTFKPIFFSHTCISLPQWTEFLWHSLRLEEHYHSWLTWSVRAWYIIQLANLWWRYVVALFAYQWTLKHKRLQIRIVGCNVSNTRFMLHWFRTLMSCLFKLNKNFGKHIPTGSSSYSNYCQHDLRPSCEIQMSNELYLLASSSFSPAKTGFRFYLIQSSPATAFALRRTFYTCFVPS